MPSDRRVQGVPTPAAVSLVVPIFNERESIPLLASEIETALASTERWECIFVDDASTDGSASVIEQLRAGENRFRLIRLSQRSGQSSALAVGIGAARYGLIATLDGDGQNDPADLPGMIDVCVSGGFDLVQGIREVRTDGRLRLLSSKIANAARNFVVRDGVVDTGCSTRVLRRTIALDLPRFDGFHRFLPALVLVRGGTLTQVRVNHRPRLSGSSKYGVWNRLGRGLLDMWGVWWLGRRALAMEHAETPVRLPVADPMRHLLDTTDETPSRSNVDGSAQSLPDSSQVLSD